MSPKQYEVLRGQLRELTVLAAKDLSPLRAEQRERLIRLEQTLRSNQFKIVLISPFQGGKSTIFNAATGGQELVPTGIGIKTSACLAEAYGLPDNTPEPFAEVFWKNDRELLLGFVGAIEDRLIRQYSNRFSENASVIDQLDLGVREDRQLLFRTINSALEAHDGKTETQSAIHLDLLKIGYLTLKHYEHFLEERSAPKMAPPDTVASWIRFPDRWESRRLNEFNSAEVKFLYISTVRFWLRSDELSRLSAILIDCPGLNASPWDTAITNRCIAEAHAVILLLGSEGRGISQQIISDIELFAKYGLQEGVFLAYNVLGQTRKIAQDQWLPNDLAKLRQIGINFPEDRTTCFNALLALRSKQLVLLNENSMSASSSDALVVRTDKTYDEIVLQGKSDLEKVEFLVRNQIKQSYRTFTGIDLEEELTKEVAEKIYDISGWSKVIGQAAEFVIQRRGRAMLIDRGVDILSGEIDQLDGDLASKEESSRRTVEEFALDEKKARKALNEFSLMTDGVRQRFKDRFGEKVALESGYGSPLLLLFEELKNFIERAKPDLRRQFETVIDNVGSEREVAVGIQEAATDVLSRRISGWAQLLASGQSIAAKSIIFQNISDADADVQELLQNALTQGGYLLKGLNVNKVQVVELDTIRKVAGSNYGGCLVDNTLRDVESIKFVGRAVAKVRDWYELGRNNVFGEPFDREAHRKEIKRYLNDLFGEDLDKVLHTEVASTLKAYSDAVDSQIMEAVDKVKRAYEDRVKEYAEQFKQKDAERKQIAAQCQRIRSELIAPFREKLRTFRREVEQALN